MFKEIDVRQVLSMRGSIAVNLSSDSSSKMRASTNNPLDGKEYKIMEEFHVHIYFTKNEIELAQQIRDDLIHAIPQLTYVGELILKPIGPHPRPMFEIHVPAAKIDSIVPVIDKKRSGLSVLIHPVQDDELAAHTVFARWLGEKLKLDLSQLDSAKNSRHVIHGDI